MRAYPNTRSGALDGIAWTKRSPCGLMAPKGAPTAVEQANGGTATGRPGWCFPLYGRPAASTSW